ncbi:hypothetical protein [Motilimonas cestriensis]|uniref:hypothetical protein n=1 Tax=Motilimonas cestriensis TaxID=2742685 RepID=UPI001E49D106|nr:hypothetical protein [Motilimonas cestriensis]
MGKLILKPRRYLHLVWLALLLNACAAPLLLMTPQGQLMWALMKPLVGLDPNDVNLLEQPLIKNRMEPLLGEHYQTAVSLLKTADEIQQQGPLYYVISNHTPVPQLAEKAGLVWNADTNQMAVMLLTGGSPQVFAEQLLNQQMEEIVPIWPTELLQYTDPKILQQKAAEQLIKRQQDAKAELIKQAQAQIHAGGKLVTEQVLPLEFNELPLEELLEAQSALPD